MRWPAGEWIDPPPRLGRSGSMCQGVEAYPRWGPASLLIHIRAPIWKADSCHTLPVRPWNGSGAWVAPGGDLGQPAEVMGPAFRMAGALLGTRQAGVGQAQQGSVRLLDQVDLDQ